MVETTRNVNVHPQLDNEVQFRLNEINRVKE